jgi:hypothetical protein
VNAVSSLDIPSRIAFAFMVLFRQDPTVDSAVYWFMMQIAMVVGFATTYPANRRSGKADIKHGM